MRSRSSLLVECERCGGQQNVERAGRFRDDDFYELLHDYFELELILNRERRENAETIAGLRQLIAHLEVPTLEQIEIRELRAILDARADIE